MKKINAEKSRMNALAFMCIGVTGLMKQVASPNKMNRQTRLFEIWKSVLNRKRELKDILYDLDYFGNQEKYRNTLDRIRNFQSDYLTGRELRELTKREV